MVWNDCEQCDCYTQIIETHRDSEVGAVVGLDIEGRMPVSALVLDDRVTIGTSDA